jgi:hypothetical protein
MVFSRGFSAVKKPHADISPQASNKPALWVLTMLQMLQKFGAWLTDHWPEAATALATAASAFFLWQQRRDQLRSEEPEVECTIAQDRKTGWVTIDIVVRNFRPYSLHVLMLRILRPRGAVKICRNHEARKYNTDKREWDFLAPKLHLNAQVNIDLTLKPYGMEAEYMRTAHLKTAEGDAISERFWALLPAEGEVCVKMALICELRTRVVRTQKIPIRRTITISATNSAD